MTIRQRLVASFVAVSLLVGVVGVFGLSASRILRTTVEGGDRHFRTIATAATELASYARRGQGHLTLYLTLHQPDDREKFFDRYESLREQLALLEEKVREPRALVLLEKIRVREGQILELGNRLLEAYDQALAAGGEFSPAAHRGLVESLERTVDEVAGTAIRLAHLETSFLNRQELITASSEMSNLAKQAESELMRYLLTDSVAAREGYFDTLNPLRRTVEHLEEILLTSPLAHPQPRFGRLTDHLQSAGAKLLAARQASSGSFDFQAHRSHILQLHEAASGLREAGVHLAEAGVAAEARHKQEILSRAAVIHGGILAAMVIAVLLALVVSYLMARSILAPVDRLVQAVGRLGQGALNCRIELPGHDEIGVLADAFNRMTEDLQRTMVSRDYVENILTSMMDVLLVLSPDQEVVKANPAAERLLDYRQEDLVGRSVTELVDEPSRSWLIPWLLEKGTVHDLEVNYLTRGGSPVPVLFSGAVMKDAAGEVIGLVCVGRDLTARRQAEAENRRLQARLDQARKLETIGTLAGGIAHDFNNLLTPILGFSELTQANLPPGHPGRDYLEHVLTATGRAKDLVHQILTFSRPAEGELRPVDLKVVVEEAAALLRPDLPPEISLRLDLQPGCSPVRADATQLHQLVMNLVTNACQAMTEGGGRLEIGLAPREVRRGEVPELVPGPYLCLTVADTGVGMEAAIRERIFEPFFTTKGVGGGTGLGLSVVHGIVRSFGGTIEVESQPGRGTRFRILLPVYCGPAQVRERISGPPGGSERILFVDDEAGVTLLGKEMLEFLGYRVTTAGEAGSALEILREDPLGYDLVVTDLAMPGMNGIALAREIGRLRPDLPIILLTGHIGGESSREAREAGVGEFVLKPVAAEELNRAIRRALAGKTQGESALASKDVGLQA